MGDNPPHIEAADDGALTTIWQNAAEAIKLDPPLLMTFYQLVIAKALTLRAQDTTRTATGNDADRIQARDVVFHDPNPLIGLPLGAVTITVRASKAIKASGRGKANGEIHRAGATGDHLCPVAALRHIFATYGLHEAGREHEFVFASLKTCGRRIYSNPASWTGSKPIQATELNERISRLCELGKVPRFTGRNTRHGSASDMLLYRLDRRVTEVMGSWQPGSETPYQKPTLAMAGMVLGHKILHDQRVQEANDILTRRVR